MKETLLYQKLVKKQVRCNICQRRCLISEGKSGYCQTRINQKGILYTTLYGLVSSINLDPIENMVGAKFNYNNSNGFISQAVLYLSINTNKENDQQAEINNIRREINNLRKEMNLKFSNKINIMFEKNSFWDEINSDLIEQLFKRLGVDLLNNFVDKLDEYKTIKTFTGNNIKLFIYKS